MATRKKLISKSAVVISDKVRDYSNDPFILKKNRKAKALLEKYGFPEELVSRASRKK